MSKSISSLALGFWVQLQRLGRRANVTSERLTCNDTGGYERKHQTPQNLHQHFSGKHEVFYFSGCHVVRAQREAQDGTCKRGESINEASVTPEGGKTNSYFLLFTQ